jgi:hypothetical protein
MPDDTRSISIEAPVVDGTAPHRRASDTQVDKIVETVERIDSGIREVFRLVCPPNRVCDHETRMDTIERRLDSSDQRFNGVDTRLTTLGGAITEVRQAIMDSQKFYMEALSTERNERSLWLKEHGALITVAVDGLTRGMDTLGGRVEDQGSRIEGLANKLQAVMETNQTLLAHQQNGLPETIAAAIEAKVTAAAKAHAIEIEADAKLLEAQVKAEVKKNPWWREKLLGVPSWGWVIIPTVVIATLVIAKALGVADPVDHLVHWLTNTPYVP